MVTTWLHSGRGSGVGYDVVTMWSRFGSNLVTVWVGDRCVVRFWFDAGSDLVPCVTTLKIKVIYNVTYAKYTKYKRKKV